MRVVIVGAGHDGSYLAERLVAEGQEVVIIEADEEKTSDKKTEDVDETTDDAKGADKPDVKIPDYRPKKEEEKTLFNLPLCCCVSQGRTHFDRKGSELWKYNQIQSPYKR